jgi:hypothetical protein
MYKAPSACGHPPQHGRKLRRNTKMKWLRNQSKWLLSIHLFNTRRKQSLQIMAKKKMKKML